MSAALARVLDRAPAPSQRLRDAAVAASEAQVAACPNLAGLWRAIVDGRYGLVESFEQGGRRYYVLHENLDRPLCEVRLSARERSLAEAVGRGESEKAVAFALGVTPSAVSSILRSTLLKLGLRSKFELAMLAGALCESV